MSEQGNIRLAEMIPATGWRAIFKTETGFFTEPVAIWGKVENPGGVQSVVGFCVDGQELRPVTESSMFHSYCPEGEARFFVEDLKEGRL